MPLKLQNWPIADLPGFSAADVAHLEAADIQTSQDLLRQGRSPLQRQHLSQRLQLPVRCVQKWVTLAELSQLPSVGCQHCGLLLHSGISSTKQLAQASPGKLYSQIRRLHTLTMNRSDLCPTPDMVVAWIREAQQIQAQHRPSA